MTNESDEPTAPGDGADPFADWEDPDRNADARTDGGNVSSPFEVVSEYEESRGDRLRKLYDTYVYAPIAIIWRDWRARIGFSIVLFYLLMGIVGPYLIDPTQVAEGPALVEPFQNWEYPLGTDNMGRDLLSQTVHSTSTILKMIASGALVTVAVGTLIGGVAGYKGGTTDTVLSSITDVFINLPGFPLVMILAALLPVGENPYMVGVLLSVGAWGGLARAIRSQVLTIRHESYVEAARGMGIPTHRIVFKEIIPQLMPYVVINLTNAARRVIFEAVALYYLAILPFSSSSLNWGVMLNQAYQEGAHYTAGALHWFLVPMATIIGISIGLILLGQSLDRVFNPRVRARHEKTTGEGGEPDADEPNEQNTNVVGGI
ncbi:ABC transporter permease [Halopiger aswanensis]|uniref:Peptide/nickel transport system permease protein n=1 Tax=Halopiger aswanensis TaxID=148449 RepID=A0A3R7DB52_9EURY|nr:ABC transporter permease [Halopiger aswanensis]RKD89203.1 peptide/nickel transport system permease protein [Halopiger aswanensis]